MTTRSFTPAMLYAVGGLVAWAAHFGAVYGLTGLACARNAPEAVPWSIGIATLAALVLIGALCVRAYRRRGRDLLDWLAGATAGLGAVAILWQALPVLMVPVCG